MNKLTKTELQLIEDVRSVNRKGILCGLGTSPESSCFFHKGNRFIKRLHESGLLIWVLWTPKYGAGWALPETVELFKV